LAERCNKKQEGVSHAPAQKDLFFRVDIGACRFMETGSGYVALILLYSQRKSAHSVSIILGIPSGLLFALPRKALCPERLESR
jgi:hypothetical protein